jgi:catecholate siderophore receptor
MGPSSLLFGRGSTGGALNQVSKTPGLKTANEVQISAMSTGLVRTVMDSNIKMTDTSAFRVSAMGQTGSPTGRDQTNTKDAGIAPSFKFGIGEPTTITLSALVQHNNDQVDYGILNLNGGFVDVNRKNAYGFNDDRTISNVMSLNAVVEHKLSSTGKIRNQTSFTRVLTDAQETTPGALGTLARGRGFVALPSASTRAIPAALTTNLPLTDLWVRQMSRDRNIQDNSIFNLTEFSDEFKTGQIKHNVLVGFEMSHDTYNAQFSYRNGTCANIALAPLGGSSAYVGCTPLLNPVGGNSPDNTQRVFGTQSTGSATDFGLYVSDTIELTPGFKLVAGLRQDRYSATVGRSISNASNPARVEQTVNQLSMRGGALWQPTTAQSYYLSYSTSFNPSLEQLTNTTGGTAPLPPQQNRAYELGGKWDLNDGKLSLTGALFQITQYNARAQDVLGTYTATGTVQVKGARLGAVGRLTDKLQIFGGYTMLDATIVNGIAPGTEGNTPANTPKHSGSLWGVYSVTPDWEVGGGATYAGQRYANNANLVEAESYVRFDATLAYRQPTYDVRLNLYNLANTSYYDALAPSQGGRAVPGLGRSAMVTLNVRF